ncbi:helix-turn-helix transcriptional regulator [Billgrantia kenyensis]|uniref:Helix-turn-helix domain-containing protein n=1 Tax=Billgrantia kenyensis TaxID=321266 RepID=A0A7W0AG23_9GAMM|nr:helix-turn-helix domain-containing protein [Halomonas kenyensis]MBA2781164.1 helix-turn-helix domain-containing protein [Halomonas kenyensis]MCG6663862.1 helix-turn-helix domain-containing protein [Halomonas kenyensis]
MIQLSGEKYLLPSPYLRAWIDFYVQSHGAASDVPLVTHLPSSATATLTLVLSGKASLLDAESGRIVPLPQLFVSGPQRSSATMVAEGQFRCLVVVFAPGCWDILFDAAPENLADRRQEVSGLGCRWLHAVVDEMTTAAPQMMMQRLEEGLRGWIRQAASRRGRFGESDTRWMRDALLHTAPGEMAQIYGLSLRQIERRFRHQFGLSPKAYQRLARMALLLARHGQAPASTPLAVLAAELGYADQAHLSREHKQLIGVPPARLGRLVEEDPEYWVYRILPGALATGSGMSRFFKP